MNKNNSLVAQLDKLAAHNRQGSYKTKERYYEAMRRFCAFLADVYHVQRLANISGKHLAAYVEYMQAEGKAPSTIKTDLAAIRFFHDKIIDAKYRLPNNDELAVELARRTFGGVDRTWSDEAFVALLMAATAAGREDYVLALHLARHTGLRIHECFRIDTATAERALRENAITIKGKGGKVRTVPFEETVTPALLRHRLEITPRGHKLLVPDDVRTDTAITELQQYIEKHRTTPHMTFHGLRHTWAAEKYKRLIEGGMGALDAHFEVSRLLGHERPDVTDIYLASLA